MKPFTSFQIVILTLCLLPSFSFADDGNTMYYYSKSSMIPTTYYLDDIDKITFSDSGIQMHTVNGMNEINFSDFLLFTFREIKHPYITTIKPMITSQDITIHLDASSRILHIESSQNIDDVIIYNVRGTIVSQMKSVTTCHIPLISTPTGVYLVKVVYNGKTLVHKILL